LLQVTQRAMVPVPLIQPEQVVELELVLVSLLLLVYFHWSCRSLTEHLAEMEAQAPTQST
jgi:hypothetical protein